MENEMILIIDFGSQYTQLIARKIRELNVYCEIHPYNKIPTLTKNMKGVVLSGSPFSVRDSESPNIDLKKIRNKLPLLGICYGAQLMAKNFGGEVLGSKHREYGKATLNVSDKKDKLLMEIDKNSQVWMSHGDTITKLPTNSYSIANTENIDYAAYKFDEEKTYGVQFHPEVYHTKQGNLILKNFVVDICECKQSWTPENFIETTVSQLKEKLGNDKVVLGLSGGVDSTVAAVLLSKAIKDNLYCIFIDNGLLRKNEFEKTIKFYKDNLSLNVIGVDASNEFVSKLKRVLDPETKRKIIGTTFIDVFDREATRIKGVKWLGQGTIYPDVIESRPVKGPSFTIKSHHNVGGLPDYMKLKLVEPLNTLFKDEVRIIGHKLGIAPDLINKHPFPGPGLAIRCVGDITNAKLELLRNADNIFIEGLKKANLYTEVWQAGVMLLPVKSVGVMGDERSYEFTVALRAVTSVDGMTADWARLPYDFLADISNEIINKVKGINRVVYDISSKPPATIEWE